MFKATELFQSFITELQRRQDEKELLKNKNVGLTGSECVNILLELLGRGNTASQEDPDSRLKVTQLCSNFVTTKVLVPTRAALHEFIDNEAELYHVTSSSGSAVAANFISQNALYNSHLSESLESLQSLSMCETPRSTLLSAPRTSLKRNLSSIRASFRIKKPATGYGTETPKAKTKSATLLGTNLAQTLGTRSFLTSPAVFKSNASCGQSEEDFVAEMALFRLLTMIDLPVLDNILHVTERKRKGLFGLLSKSPSRSPLSSAAINSVPSSSTQNLTNQPESENPWLRAGQRCLDSKANRRLSSDRSYSAKELHQQQYVLFNSVAKHYQAHKNATVDVPLIGSSYSEILQQLYHACVTSSKPRGVEAIQLLLLIVPATHRIYACRLLRFLHIVSDSNDVRLSSSVLNLDVCIEQFVSTFFPVSSCKDLTKSQIWFLLQFMIENAPEMLELPRVIRKALQERSTKRNYTVAVPEPPVTYCDKIAPATYDRESQSSTDEALVALAKNILQSDSMDRKAKQTWLDQFRSQYPVLFYHHLNETMF